MDRGKDRIRQPGIRLALVACLLFGSGARADGPARVIRDFFPGEFEGGEPVSQLTRLGNTLFFVADDLDTGRTVWRTTGAAAGTRQVPIAGPELAGDAIIAGRVGARVLWLVRPSGDPVVQTLVAATEQGDGVVLHTYAPKDLPAIVGGRFFFQDCDAAGCVLWSTDGTVAGTRPVPALAGFQATDQAILATFADRWLVFRSRERLLAYDVARNQVLTLLPSGARRAEVRPAGQNLYVVTQHDRARVWVSRLGAPRAVQVFASRYIWVAGWLGDVLYFVADGGPLWSTDGRRENTRPYSGLRVEPYSALADELGAIGSQTFLPMAGYYTGGLLRIDEVRREVTDLNSICSGKYSCMFARMSKVTVLGNRAFEVVNSSLWQSDGTREGTKYHDVLDLADASTFRVLDGRLLLGATSYDGEQQLWETDGTANGTRSLTDGTLDRPFQVQGPPVPFDDALFVAAEHKPVGKQLWRVEDGHTTAVTDLRHLPSGSDPYFAQAVGERFVLGGSRLNRWFDVGEDGSAEEFPMPIEGCSFYEIPCPRERVVVGKRLVFSPYPGVELLSTDGTAAGTGRVFEDFFQLAALGSWRGEALALDYLGGVWATDGTRPGTRLVARLPDAPELGEYPAGPPVPAGPLVYLFRRVAGGYGNPTLELWRTDGTAEGTLRLTAIPFPSLDFSVYLDPAVVGGRLFFRFFGVLWTSDGTVAGTRPLPQQLPVGTIALDPGEDVLYATSEAFGSSGEQGLWAIDPETLEPTLLASSKRIGVGAGTPVGSLLGNALFFKRMDEQLVERWWVTEGTPESTHPLPDFLADNTSAQFVTAGDRRYFTACEPEHGCELWSTDRLGEDTRLVQDLWPGPRSGDPLILSATATSLLFAATNPDVGRELWKLDL